MWNPSAVYTTHWDALVVSTTKSDIWSNFGDGHLQAESAYIPKLIVDKIITQSTDFDAPMRYVRLADDPSGWDYTETTLSTTGSYTDLDLSSKIPANAKMVHIWAEFTATVANGVLLFRPNGNSNGVLVIKGTVAVANGIQHIDGSIPCDSNQVVEYYRHPVVNSIDIVIKGYWY